MSKNEEGSGFGLQFAWRDWGQPWNISEQPVSVRDLNPEPFEIWNKNATTAECSVLQYFGVGSYTYTHTHTHTHTHVSSLKTPQNTKNIIYIIQLSSYALPPLTVSCLGGRESANMRYGQMILPRQPWTAEGSNYTINETVHSRYKASKWHVMF